MFNTTNLEQNDSNNKKSKPTKPLKFKECHSTYFNQTTIQPAASEIILGNYTPINEMSFDPGNDETNDHSNDGSVSHEKLMQIHQYQQQTIILY